MTAEHSLSLLGVGIRLTGEPDTLAAVLAELGEFAGQAGPVLAGQPVHELPLASGATTGAVLAELTRLAVTESPLLCVHAGVVAAGHGSLLIPGTSGLGKTTLVAALVRAGFGYLSDEVLAVDRARGVLSAFPRPLALAAESWTLLGLDPASTPDTGQERLIGVHELGSIGRPAPVREILLAERRPGPPELSRLPRGVAVQAILSRSFNHFRDPAGSFHAVLDLIRQATVWRAGYQDAPELAELLAGRWLASH